MNLVKDFFTGVVIGIANIIPGVSGGTMALVLGIYERLIAAIQNISPDTVKTFLQLFRFSRKSREDACEEFKRIDGLFLIVLTIGALAAVAALAKLMTILLSTYHDPTYGFFFGLVLLSVVPPYKLIHKKSVSVLLAALLGIAAVFAVSQTVSSEKLIKRAQIKYELKLKHQANDTPSEQAAPQEKKNIIYFLYIFLLGAISISAMILPGVSGSLLLLVMGGYFAILQAIAGREWITLGVFALGCLIGIVLFTRLLNFFLKRWHNQSMGFLMGLVIGSLWMIWPFKHSQLVGDQLVYLANKIPESFGIPELYTLFAMFAGMAVVAVFLFIEARSGKVDE